MILSPQFKDRVVAVMGLGRSGVASAKSLAASGAKVWAWDDNAETRSRAATEGIPLVDLMTCDWRKPKALVLSPGIPLRHPMPHPVAALARSADCEVIGDIELLARAKGNARLCGITGTNGKSTTTALIGHILKESGVRAEIGGNLGKPALALEPLGEDGVYVLEVSSYQLDLADRLTFDVAVLLNVSPDHLNRHGGLEGYIRSKSRIFHNQTKKQTAVVGIDDRYTASMIREFRSNAGPRVVPISGSQQAAGGVFVSGGNLYDDTGGATARVLDMRAAPHLPGTHNAQNAAAAYAAARALGLKPEVIAANIKTFPGLAHRQELVAVVNGVRYINDSKATNADAAEKALACYSNVYWIAGGRPKEGGIVSLAPLFGNIVHAFLIGEATDEFAATLEGHVPYLRCGDLATAVARAGEMAQLQKKPDAVVLLSPACASFDQWENFEARGNGFKNLVAALPGARSGNPGAPRAVRGVA